MTANSGLDTGHRSLPHLYNCSLSCSLHCSSDTCMAKLQRCNCKAQGFYSFPHFSPHVWNNSPKTASILLLSLPSKTTSRHFSFPNISPNQHCPSTRSTQRSFYVPILHASHFAAYVFTSGSAVAHFRFKDEEGWEEDGKGDNATTAAAQVLSLDCTQLAASLDCLPLYTQLHLDTDIFTVGNADSFVCTMCYYCVCLYSVSCGYSVFMCVGVQSDCLPLYTQLHLDTAIFTVSYADRTLCVCCVLLLCVCVCGRLVWTVSLSTLSFTWMHIFMVGDAASCVCAVCYYCACVHVLCMRMCALCVCVCSMHTCIMIHQQPPQP